MRTASRRAQWFLGGRLVLAGGGLTGVDAGNRRDDRFGVAPGILLLASGIGVPVMQARLFRGSAG